MQTISASKQYDAFGNVVSSSGTFNGPFSYGGKFGYQSDSDTSYQLLGHRYYDPSTGRFLTSDPIGDGENWYAYARSNPISNADPSGLKPRKNKVIIIVGAPNSQQDEESGAASHFQQIAEYYQDEFRKYGWEAEILRQPRRIDVLDAGEGVRGIIGVGHATADDGLFLRPGSFGKGHGDENFGPNDAKALWNINKYKLDFIVLEGCYTFSFGLRQAFIRFTDEYAGYMTYCQPGIRTREIESNGTKYRHSPMASTLRGKKVNYPRPWMGG